MKIEVVSIDNIKCSKKRALIRRAMHNGQAVLSSYKWKDRIRQAKFEHPYAYDKKFSSSEICTYILTGKDGKNAPADSTLQIDITGYWSFKKVVGYTFLGSLKSWINRRVLRRMDEADVFGHVLHEAMHRYGFSHPKRKNRRLTVPYQVGRISEDCYRETYEN